MPAAVELVPFHDDTLVGLRDDGGKAWVALRPMCEALGLDVDGQRQRLKKQAWACTGVIPVHDSSDREQAMFCLALESVPMWLATIQASRVAEALRGKLEMYQREAHDVLADHFLRRGSQIAQVLPPQTLAIIERVADGISKPIVRALADQGQQITQVRNDVDSLKTEQKTVRLEVRSLREAMERAEELRRRRPNKEDKRTHIEFARTHQRTCPMFCQTTPLFDADNNFRGEIHHIVKVSDASLLNLMVACGPCNKRANSEPLPGHFSETYRAKFLATREQASFGFLKRTGVN